MNYMLFSYKKFFQVIVQLLSLFNPKCETASPIFITFNYLYRKPQIPTNTIIFLDFFKFLKICITCIQFQSNPAYKNVT